MIYEAPMCGSAAVGTPTRRPLPRAPRRAGRFGPDGGTREGGGARWAADPGGAAAQRRRGETVKLGSAASAAGTLERDRTQADNAGLRPRPFAYLDSCCPSGARNFHLQPTFSGNLWLATCDKPVG